VRFSDAIELFITSMVSDGRLTSRASEDAYRKVLYVHASDIGNRDPGSTGRTDAQRTLSRYTHPNTKANRRSVLVSFYDYAMEEGWRKDNPARQTNRPRKRESQVYRLTFEEATQLLRAAQGHRERRTIYLGICAGLRNQELRGLQGRHFARPGYVWVSQDIAKGGRERWVPVIPDLAAVVAHIQEHCEPDDYVIPRQQVWNLDPLRPPVEQHKQACSGQTVWRIVERVGTRAGIAAHVHPHLLRHAYGDHISRYAGIRNAQFLLGHKDISTTETYVGKPTLDELGQSIEGFTFGMGHTNERSGGPPEDPESQQYRHGDSNPGS
jgi:site-specific recombinase XerD